MKQALQKFWVQLQQDKWLCLASAAAIGTLLYFMNTLWGIRFTHFDDTNFLLASAHWPNLAMAKDIANGQGRVQFFMGVPFLLLALKFNFSVGFDILHFGSAVSFWSGFVFIIAANLGFRYAVLVATTLFATIVLIWDHTTITSGPMWFFFILTIGFISILLLKAFLNTQRNAYLYAATFLMFIGCWMQEFAAALLLWLWAGTCFYPYLDQPKTKSFLNYLRQIRKPLIMGIAAAALFAAFYAGYRVLHPAQYDAMKVFDDLSVTHGFKPWSFVWFLKSMWQLSISSQILYWMPHGFSFPYIYTSPLPATKSFDYIVWPLQDWTILFQFKYVAFALLIFIATFITLPKTEVAERRKLFVILLFALVLMLIPNAFVALSLRYQNWVRQGTEAYAYTHFAIIGFALTLATALRLVLSYFPKPYQKTSALLSALFLSFCGLCAAYQNDQVSHAMRLNAERMHLVNRAISADSLRPYFADKTIYAPDLFRATWSTTVPSSERWFNDFAMQKGLRSLFVVQTAKYLPLPDSYLGMVVGQECSSYYGIIGKLDSSPAGLILNKGKFIAARSPQNFYVSWYNARLQRNMIAPQFQKAGPAVWTADLPDNILLSNLVAGCTPVTAAATALAEISVPDHLSPNATIDFTKEPLGSGAQLFSGWANTEWTFRWNNGKKAIVLINLQPGIHQPLYAKLEAGPFLNGTTAKEQPLSITINGETIGQWTLRKGGPGDFTNIRFTIPQKLLKEQPMAMVFHIPNSQIPSPNDPRTLGVAFGKLHLSTKPD